MKDKKMIMTHNGSTKALIPELRGNLASIKFPCFGEIKYDGEATIIAYNKAWPENQIITTNKYGTMRSEWNKLDIIADIMKGQGVDNAMFLAELFYGDGKAGKLYQLLSNKTNPDLNLKIWDVIGLNVKGQQLMGTVTPLVERKETLSNLYISTPFYTEVTVLSNKLEAEKFFKDVTDQGYEGCVLKPFDGALVDGPCPWVKLKKKDQTDYELIKIDTTKERIEIRVPNVALNKFITVGCKCANKYKKHLKVGMWVTIEHQGILDSGSLRHPVFIGISKICNKPTGYPV